MPSYLDIIIIIITDAKSLSFSNYCDSFSSMKRSYVKKKTSDYSTIKTLVLILLPRTFLQVLGSEFVSPGLSVPVK